MKTVKGKLYSSQFEGTLEKVFGKLAIADAELHMIKNGRTGPGHASIISDDLLEIKFELSNLYESLRLPCDFFKQEDEDGV